MRKPVYNKGIVNLRIDTVYCVVPLSRKNITVVSLVKSKFNDSRFSNM